TRKDPRVDGNRGIRSREIRGSPPTVRCDYLRGHLRRVSHLARVRTHRLSVAVAESTSPAPAAQGRSSLEGRTSSSACLRPPFLTARARTSDASHPTPRR